MSAHILIIDPDASFAGMMSQGLRALAGYEVTLAHSGRDALAKLPAAGPVDLAILDLGTDDIAPAALIDALRAHRPGLPVLVIPIAGDETPADLPVQGAFAKPPFLPDLPALIDRALGRETAVPEPAAPAAATVEEILAAPGVAPAEERAPAPGGHPEGSPDGKAGGEMPTIIDEILAIRDVQWYAYDRHKRRFLCYPDLRLPPEVRDQLEQQLTRLSETLGFVPVMLTRANQLMARIGGMNEREAKHLARSINRSWSGSDGRSSDQEIIRFDEFLHPDAFDPFTVYSAVVLWPFYLSAAWRGRLPLSQVRQAVRETAREVARLLQEAETAS